MLYVVCTSCSFLRAFSSAAESLPVPERCWHRRLYVKLFFQDAEAAREIRLLPAAKELLRLG